MRLYSLDKKALLLKGNPTQFLNGLTSNALDKPQNAFLNMHGRIIATFDGLRLPAGGAGLSEEEYLIVIASKAVEPLKAHVERYLKINRSTLTETPLNVYFDLDGDASSPGDQVIAQKQGRLIVTDRSYTNLISADEFTLFRLEHQLPLHTVDYQDEMLLNVHEYDFVSYTKGCFLGQEMVAKVHNRSKPTWALVVRYQDELSIEEQAKMTSVVLNPLNDRYLGFVFVPTNS